MLFLQNIVHVSAFSYSQFDMLLKGISELTYWFYSHRLKENVFFNNQGRDSSSND